MTAQADSPATATLRFTPSTRVLWRSRRTVQLELGARCVAVDGLSPDVVHALGMHGLRVPVTCDQPEPDKDSDSMGALLHTLHRGGFLSRVPGGAAQPGAGHTAARTTLAPDLDSLGARFGERAAAVLNARTQRSVAVQGLGRLPPMIASLLAAAGVGHVRVADSADVTLHDVAPGGLQHTDEGRRSSVAAADAVHRYAPGTDTAVSLCTEADLTILVGDAPLPPAAHTGLRDHGRVHLAVAVWAASTVVGPLVVPGHTSCLACADLHRRDRDPAWPALAGQLAGGRAERRPSDVVVCAFAAAVTVVQSLAYLDGERPAAANGTLEMTLPDWRLRRRTWPPHPACACAD